MSGEYSDERVRNTTWSHRDRGQSTRKTQTDERRLQKFQLNSKLRFSHRNNSPVRRSKTIAIMCSCGDNDLTWDDERPSTDETTTQRRRRSLSHMKSD